MPFNVSGIKSHNTVLIYNERGLLTEVIEQQASQKMAADSNAEKNSSFDSGGNAVQGAKSSFQGQGAGVDINGGAGATLSGYNYKSAFTGRLGILDFARDAGQNWIGIAEGFGGTMCRAKESFTRVIVNPRGVASDIVDAAKLPLLNQARQKVSCKG